MPTTEQPRQPYPGLRPFEAHEADLFFGREEHVDALLARLSASHFVAVVGESGAGKSSLVRAGLLPALEAGFVVEAGSDWRVAIMRPGGTPLPALADALLAPGVLSPGGGSPQREFALAELRRGPRGVVQMVRDAHLGESCNTLIVIDQFEELFRYCRESAQKDQANIFVELLLHASRQRQVPIFVVLTMRSDFVGDCARFRGLPEMLNDNQYLTPRLTRDQLAAAIEGPARVCNGVVDRDLVDQLCNAVGDDQDQLPLLQHLLMRLWDEAVREPRPPLRDVQEPAWPRLTSAPSMQVGDLHSALSNHAQQVYESLPAGSQVIARSLFKCLTDPQSQRRDVRRDALVSEVAAVANASVDATIAVAEQFRANGRHMLMPPPDVPLDGGSRLDISHESLIRQWSMLGKWACEEGTNAREFIRLRDEAQRERSQQGELLSGRALARAHDWLKQAAPTQAWAERYGSAGDLKATLTFIQKSEEHAQRRRDDELRAARREAVVRRAFWMVGGTSLITIAVVSIIFTLWRQAVTQRADADEQRQAAVTQRAAADEQRRAAETQRAAADEQRQVAVTQRAAADEQRQVAETQRVAAEEQKERADAAAVRANRSSDKANELLLRTEQQNLTITQQNRELERARTDARADLLTVHAERALERDASLAAMLAQAALAERPPTARTVKVLRDSVAAHVPSVKADFVAARFRNYNRGRRGWLDFSLSPASLSPNDDSAITPSGSDAVIWSTTSGTPIRKLHGHTDIVGFAVFSPDGSLAVTASADYTARIWDAATGLPRETLRHGNMVNGAAFNRNGTVLVTLADDANAKVWRIGHVSKPTCDIRLPRRNDNRGDPNFVLASFSRDQNYLATVTHLGPSWQAQVWNVAADQCPRVETPLDTLTDLKWAGFSEYGNLLAAVTVEGEVIVLSVPDWKVQRRFEPNAQYSARNDVLSRADEESLAFQSLPPAIAWSTDGAYFAAANGDNSVSIVSINGTAHPVELRGHAGRVTSLSFARDDGALLTTSTDGSARVWRLAPDKQVLERIVLTGHGDAVGSGTFSHKGDTVVTAGDDSTVRSWRPRLALREWRQPAVRSAAYSSDGSRIWVSGLNRAPSGYWVSELSAATLIPRRDSFKVETEMPLSFVGTTIVERGDKQGMNIRDLREPDGSSPVPDAVRLGVNRIAGTSPDGRFAFTTTQAKQSEAFVWDFRSPQTPPEIAQLPTYGENSACRPLGVSNDKQLAWSCDSLVLITRPGQTRPVAIEIGDQSRVESARFSAGGGLLAVTLDDYSLRVFDSTSGHAYPTMKGHSGRIRALDFSAGDRFLVSASEDSTARVWESMTGARVGFVAEAHRAPLTGASFSPDGLSLLLTAMDRVLVWRCYACGDMAVLLKEARKIDRKLSPAEQLEYGLVEEKPTTGPSPESATLDQALR
jgi:WD40 repeat protein